MCTLAVWLSLLAVRCRAGHADLRAMFPAVYFEGAAATKAAEKLSDQAAAAIAAANAEHAAASPSVSAHSLDDALSQLSSIMGSRSKRAAATPTKAAGGKAGKPAKQKEEAKTPAVQENDGGGLADEDEGGIDMDLSALVCWPM